MKSIGRQEDPLVAAIKNEVAMMETLTRQFGEGVIKSPRYQEALANYKKFAAQMDEQEAARQKKSDEAAKNEAKISNYAGAGGASKAADIAKQRAEILADIEYQEKAKGLSKVAQLDLEMNRDLAKARAEQEKANISERYAFAGERSKLLAAQELQIVASTEKKKADLYKESRLKFEESAKSEQDSINVEKERLAIYKDNILASQRDLDIALSRLKTNQELLTLSRQENMTAADRAAANARIYDLEKQREAIIMQHEELKKLQDMNQSVFSNMGNAIDNFVRTGKLSFSSLAQSIIQDLISIQLRSQMTELFRGVNFFGSMFSTVGSVKGPDNIDVGGGFNPAGKAAGGPVSGNTPYLIGEQGPELFVPAGSGTIIPNGKLADMSNNAPSVVNNYNIHAIDTQSFEQRLYQSSGAIWAANQYATKNTATNRSRT
jgi:phage-related minor tail protein